MADTSALKIIAAATPVAAGVIAIGRQIAEVLAARRRREFARPQDDSAMVVRLKTRAVTPRPDPRLTKRTLSDRRFWTDLFGLVFFTVVTINLVRTGLHGWLGAIVFFEFAGFAAYFGVGLYLVLTLGRESRGPLGQRTASLAGSGEWSTVLGQAERALLELGAVRSRGTEIRVSGNSEAKLSGRGLGHTRVSIRVRRLGDQRYLMKVTSETDSPRSVLTRRNDKNVRQVIESFLVGE